MLKDGNVFYASHSKKIKSNKTFKKLEKKLSKITIYVVRVSSDMNKLLYSKPCCDCIELIKGLGFKKIGYSTGDDDNSFITEKVSNLHTNHTSQMGRYLRKLKLE